MIDQVLRMRFPNYSPNADALAPLNLVLDLKTLDDVFAKACYENTFEQFCLSVERICDRYETLIESQGEEPRLVLANAFNNHVATINFAKRYPDRFKTPDGKTIWPFVALFYTGAQQWNDVPNLPDLFTTSLKELDQDWIFKLRFLLISLVDKRIDVVPSIKEKEGQAPPEAFDEALQNADRLAFFFDLLRKAELLANKSNATREEWLNDVGESLRLLKKVYDETKEYDAVILDDALSFVGTMRAKKKFDLPTRDELLGIMEREEIDGILRKTWLLSDEEREAAENKGKREGIIEGKREGKQEGKQDLLAQMIGLRFPKATPAFIKKALKPFSDSYATELMTAVMTTSSLEEFKKKVQLLAPGC